MSNQIIEMFSRIAGKYDLMNDLLSFTLHRLWKKKILKYCKTKPEAKFLDCATGTGDIAILLAKKFRELGSVLAIDLSEEMLAIAKEKAKRITNIDFEVADVEKLEYKDDSFDCATISYGIRNVAHLDKALKEMARVVKSDGKVVILEFGMPKGLWGLLFKFYSSNIITFVGKIVVKDFFAYKYLHDTVAAFPCGNDFLKRMHYTNSYKSTNMKRLCGGISYIYVGVPK
ncbi:MAG: bifunctional demethylmenaquinone methyltransferase/2-methoxy-6-polyprenyl-1,4-benzoquinol methylase UbiE [Ignavibacteria bacterium]|nr:bifunctional demethylmenaquinone methyltransferase/2-methoxy-6-polyprenyl-1,4-benzoquinol methylase UbiE [Ignavibacteria bacterium]